MHTAAGPRVWKRKMDNHLTHLIVAMVLRRGQLRRRIRERLGSLNANKHRYTAQRLTRDHLIRYITKGLSVPAKARRNLRYAVNWGVVMRRALALEKEWRCIYHS